jgi:hypothetical protein
MTIGFDGDLFVANQTGTIQRYDIATGQLKSTFASSLPLPAGLTYDSNSNAMFVSTVGQFDSNAIYRFDAAGNVVQGNPVGNGPIVAGPATGRSGITMGPDGNLYIGTIGTSFNFFFGIDDTATIQRYDSGDSFHSFDTLTDGTSAGDGDLGTTPNLSGANSLIFDSSGNLFATSLFGQQVVKFELGGGGVTNASNFGPGFVYPSGLAFSPDGQILWISEQGNNNDMDPIYGNNLSVGAIYRYSSAGVQIGDAIRSDMGDNAAFTPVALLLSPVPEPGSATLALISLGAMTMWRRRRMTINVHPDR